MCQRITSPCIRFGGFPRWFMTGSLSMKPPRSPVTSTKHSLFRPRIGSPANQTEIEAGIAASERVLTALEAVGEPSGYLVGTSPTLADIHLAPMISCLDAAPEGHPVLARHARLSEWWDVVRQRQSVVATEPGTPEPELRLNLPTASS